MKIPALRTSLRSPILTILGLWGLFAFTTAVLRRGLSPFWPQNF
jgi:hypothetical protein